MGNNTEELTLISWKEEDAVKILTEPFNFSIASAYCIIQEKVFRGYREQREIHLKSLILRLSRGISTPEGCRDAKQRCH